MISVGREIRALKFLSFTAANCLVILSIRERKVDGKGSTADIVVVCMTMMPLLSSCASRA